MALLGLMHNFFSIVAYARQKYRFFYHLMTLFANLEQILKVAK